MIIKIPIKRENPFPNKGESVICLYIVFESRKITMMIANNNNVLILILRFFIVFMLLQIKNSTEKMRIKELDNIIHGTHQVN